MESLKQLSIIIRSLICMHIIYIYIFLSNSAKLAMSFPTFYDVIYDVRRVTKPLKNITALWYRIAYAERRQCKFLVFTLTSIFFLENKAEIFSCKSEFSYVNVLMYTSKSCIYSTSEPNLFWRSHVQLSRYDDAEWVFAWKYSNTSKNCIYSDIHTYSLYTRMSNLIPRRIKKICWQRFCIVERKISYPRVPEEFFSGILLNQTEIKLYLPFSDWFGTKKNWIDSKSIGFWFQINVKFSSLAE